MDRIFPGQLRTWKKKLGEQLGSFGKFLVVRIKEGEKQETQDDPEIVVECLVEDGATDEYSLDEIMIGSREVK